MKETDQEDPLGGALDAVVLKLGGQTREGQRLMANAVQQAIADDVHLLVQAGTGTGKSLGYLVPATLHSMASGRSVVVSTATLALQRQLVNRDLPILTEALAERLGRTPEFALLKGRHNYICKHKCFGGFPADEPAGLFSIESVGGEDHPKPVGTGAIGRLGADVLRARQWAEETDSGDRDDLVPGVDDRAWHQVSVSALECLNTKCPMLAECFSENARKAAAEADVVVTNHAMLALDAVDNRHLIPEHDLLVVDEAHELSDRVTSAISATLSVPIVETTTRLVRRGAGLRTERLDESSNSLLAVLSSMPGERMGDGLPDDLRDVIQGIRDGVKDLLSVLKEDSKDSEIDGGRKQAQAGLLQLFEIAERFLAANEHDVVWCTQPGDHPGAERRPPTIEIAPLSVAGILREQVFGDRIVVLTSATLTLGGSFDAIAKSVGLNLDERLAMDAVVEDTRATRKKDSSDDRDADELDIARAGAQWRAIDVGSPFEYARQGICYIASDLPSPGRDGTSTMQSDRLANLVIASGGGALGLFSSRRAATEAAEMMRERCEFPVFCQGDDVLPTLVEKFASDPRACLFGTLSLWQGVDVPGDTCRLVVIDRIPFPRPDDPIRSARSEAVAANGGNGFMSVAATHAALLLAQGAGRLIRRAEDKGMVAILDSRLSTARYGSYLRRSLPPLWVTTDESVALAALGRLRTAALSEFSESS